MMDRKKQAQGGVERQNASGRFLVTFDAFAARPIPQPRGVSEKAGSDPSRHGSALEVIETKFLLAIGQHVKCQPLSELDGQLSALSRIGGIAAVVIVDLCYLRYYLGCD